MRTKPRNTLAQRAVPIKYAHWILLILFIILSFIYMLSTPIWESLDEASHYAMVDYIASTGKLPHQDPTIETAYHQEGSQPPLYYALLALFVSPIDRSAPRQIYNPHSKIGIGLATDNQNLLMHDSAAEQFPWRGATLATMLGRLLSILLGTGTVYLSFIIARLTFPQHLYIALLAMALIVFNPMFLFVTASVNNDNLVIFLATCILALLLKLWRFGWHWRKIMMIAVLLALSLLTKLSGLTFIPTVGLVIFLLWRREKRPMRDLLVAAAINVITILVIAGWWYLRNMRLYGDFTGLNAMVEIIGKRPANFDLIDLWGERASTYYSFWGWFGVLNVLSPTSFFKLTYFICFVALGGLLSFFVSKRLRHDAPLDIILILLFQIALVMVGVMRWSLQTPASQGRLIFPAIAAITTLLALGLFTIMKLLRARAYLAFIPMIPLAIYAFILPFNTIQAAYKPSFQMESLPKEARLVDVYYGPIQLLAYEVNERPLQLDKNLSTEVEITLYWRPLAPTEQPLSFYIQVFGPPTEQEAVLLGKLDSYPSRGLRRTTTWQANRIYAESYRILIKAEHGLTPFQPRFKVGWRDNATNAEIFPHTQDNQPIDAVILRSAASIAQSCQTPQASLKVNFGNLARLDHFEIGTNTLRAGDILDLYLDWTVIGETQADLSIFVQIIDPLYPAQLIGTGDASPRQDWYPTSTWQKDSCFRDYYRVQTIAGAPSGNYQLLLGFYNPHDGTRLAVRLEQGESTPFHDAYLLNSLITITQKDSE